MDIFTYADALNLTLVVTRHSQQSGRWSANFDGVHIRDGCVISGVYGNGSTPAEAIKNYAERISGQLIEYKHYNSASEHAVTVRHQVPMLTT